MQRLLTPNESARLPEFDATKFDAVLVDLSAVPHGPVVGTKRGHKGSHIEFHDVDGLCACTHTGEWAPIKYWSRHRDVLLEIVDLSNGAQVFTDDDPRAILGYVGDSLVRVTPSEALFHGVRVPVRPAPVDYHAQYDGLEQYETFSGAYGRHVALKFDGIGPTRIDYMDGVFVLSPARHLPGDYARVVSVQETGHLVTGYDLTVPGHETFMDGDGVVLSNTLGVFIPSMPAAVNDVKERLMPSKQVYSIRDSSRVVNAPSQDLVWGLWRASTSPSKQSHRFLTRGDALRAIQQGRISLSDDVEVVAEGA